MIRTFQPVGQGTFVTEQFEQGYNVVFDCGSATSVGLVKELIRTNFREGELIDGVFISSVDREHAGGLEALMQWCRVEKVFIPLLSDDEKACTLLRHLCEGGQADDFLGQLITDPKTALSAYQILDRRMPIVTQVAEETRWDKNVFDKDMEMGLIPWRAVSGLRLCVDAELDWIYQVQVYRQRADIERLTAVLIAKEVDPGWIASAETVKRAWIQNPVRRLLQEAYAELEKPLCAVSLAVYSGPQRLDLPMYEQYTEQGKWTYHAQIRAGGLYTGCLYLGEEQIRTCFLKQFGKYRPRIGCLLLPGHGAESMFHEEILPKRSAVAVAAVDNENTQCLPHGNVVRTIMERCIPFFLVTELPGSTVRFAITESLG